MMYDYLLAQPRQHQVTVDVICFELDSSIPIDPQSPKGDSERASLYFLFFYSIEFDALRKEKL